MNLDYGLTAAVLVFLINIGIFSRKEDVSLLRAEMYQSLVSKAEFEARLSRIEDKLDKLFSIMTDAKHV